MNTQFGTKQNGYAVFGALKNKSLYAVPAALAAAVVLFAACSNPLSPNSGNGVQMSAAGGHNVFITSFEIKTRGDRNNPMNPTRIITQGSGIDNDHNRVSTSAPSAVLVAGRNAMNPSNWDQTDPQELIPVISATQGAVILPLSDRYLRKAFPSDNVYFAALDWAQRLKVSDANTGLESQYILELINQQNATGTNFQKPVFSAQDPTHPETDAEYMRWQLPVDFTTPADVVVVTPAGATRSYKIVISGFTAIPVFVNSKMGKETNTGTSWSDAFQTLRRALEIQNPNDDPNIPKEIWIAGGKETNGDAYKYDLEVEIPVDNAKITPPVGGIKIKGGFRGIETSGNARDDTNDADLYPVVIYNSNPSTVGDTKIALLIKGIPVTLETVTLTGHKEGKLKMEEENSQAVYIDTSTGDNTGAAGTLTLSTRGIVAFGLNKKENSQAAPKPDGGGGVRVVNGARLILEGGAVTNSKAQYGGGVFVDHGTVNIRGGKIAGNMAEANAAGSGGGGGIYVGQNGNNSYGEPQNGAVNFITGAITGNIAVAKNKAKIGTTDGTGSGGNGGGVYVAYNDTAPPNEDKLLRGGFYMGKESRTLSAGQGPQITGNIAQNLGGGIYYEKGALVRKSGDVAGDASGRISGIDGGFPALSDKDENFFPTKTGKQINADENQLSESNIAFGVQQSIAGGEDQNIYWPPVGSDINWPPTKHLNDKFLIDAYGHAICMGKNGSKETAYDNFWGSYNPFDSDSTSNGGSAADGTIHDFTVMTQNTSTSSGETTLKHELRVMIVQDQVDGTNHIPGKITVWIPDYAIDNYKTGGTVNSNITATVVKVNPSALVLQLPYDTNDQQRLVSLFPNTQGIVTQGVAQYYRLAMPVESAKNTSPAAQAAALQRDFDSWVTRDSSYDITAGKETYKTYRADNYSRTLASTNSTLYSGPAAPASTGTSSNLPPVDYGLSPWYVVFGSDGKPHVFYTEVVLEAGAPLYVDPASSITTHDGSSWLTAFASIKDAAARAQNGQEIWVKNGDYSGASGEVAVGWGQNISILGGFKGSELTKKQRVDVDGKINSTVKYTFGNIGDSARVTVQYAETSAAINLPGRNTLVLDEGAKVVKAGITAKNGSNIVMTGNAELDGTTGTSTGLILENGSTLRMQGKSKVSKYTKGGVYLKGAEMTMEEGAQVSDNTLTLSGNPAIDEAPIAAGVTLIDSNLTLIGLAAGSAASYGPNPVLISNNTVTATTASGTGGGVYARGASVITMASAILEGSDYGQGAKITGNVVANGNGGGVYLDKMSKLKFVQGEISRNAARGSDQTGNGGGVYLAGSLKDVGPGRFVNENGGDDSTLLKIKSYNNGVILDMSAAKSQTGTNWSETAIIAGNTAANKGGGVYLNPGAMLYKYVGRSVAANNGAIFGATYNPNSAPSGKALYDENSQKQGQTALYYKTVDEDIYKNSTSTGDNGSYPPDLNYAADYDYTTGDGSSYYQGQAPNRNNEITFELSKPQGSGLAVYPGAVTNTASDYKHLAMGETTVDPHAAAYGEIKLRLPLDIVASGDTDDLKKFTIKIKTAQSNVTTGASGTKIIMPLAMYPGVLLAKSLNTIFPAPQTWDGQDTGATHYGTPPAWQSVDLAMRENENWIPGTNDATMIGSMTKIQNQADNLRGTLFWGTAKETVKNADNTNALYAPDAANPNDGMPKLSLTAREGPNAYYLYAISESGNVRLYRLLIDVYTAVPKYVGTQNTKWGQDDKVPLSTAVAAAQTAKSAVDIWVEQSQNATGNWQATGVYTIKPKPVTITGGFKGTEIEPNLRPRMYAHIHESTYKPQERSDDGTIEIPTQGPNVTKISFSNDLTVEGTTLTFTDIDVTFDNNKSLIVQNGGRLELENATLTFSGNGGIQVLDGQVFIKDSDMKESAKIVAVDSGKNESKIHLQGSGVIQLGTQNTGAGKLTLEAGEIHGQIIVGDVNLGTAGGWAPGTVRNDSGSTLTLGPDDISVLNRSAIKVGDGKTAVRVASNAKFDMKGGVITGSGTLSGIPIGVLVSGASGQDYKNPGATFKMSAGIIKNFKVNNNGIGVDVQIGAVFEKTGGAIYGDSEASGNAYSLADRVNFVMGKVTDTPLVGANVPAIGGTKSQTTLIFDSRTDNTGGAMWKDQIGSLTTYTRAGLTNYFDVASVGNMTISASPPLLAYQKRIKLNNGELIVGSGSNMGTNIAPSFFRANTGKVNYKATTAPTWYGEGATANAAATIASVNATGDAALLNETDTTGIFVVIPGAAMSKQATSLSNGTP